MSGSKLVENLAESLVNELSESKTLDLMNDQKFSEFTDLLWEILDRVDKAEDREKEKEKELEKEKSNEDETLKSVKALADKITEYFGKSGESNGKTEKILKIVQNLQKDDKEGSGESDEDKKKKKLTLGKKTKEQKDIEETKEKIEQEKKDEEKAKVDKQTMQMLNKLTKDFEKSEKDRKKQNSWVRKGLKRVERKIGSLIWKALNKFKGILLIGALIFFRKPIINFFKGIWEKYLKPHVAPLVEKLGEKVGGLFNMFKGWFESTFPELNKWIEKELPKIKAWFKENWENIKTWFTETIPTIMEAVQKFLGDTWLGKKLDKKLKESRKTTLYNQAATLAEENDPRWKEKILEADELALESAKADKKEWEEKGFIGRNLGWEDVLMANPATAPTALLYKVYKNKKTSNEFDEDIKRIERDVAEDISRLPKRANDNNSGFVPPDATNDNLPEYGNPAGGMGGQYSAADVDSGKSNNVVDNSSVTYLLNNTTINQISQMQQGDSLITPP